MSRFLLVNLGAGFLAAAIGYGDVAGIPSQAVFVARWLAGLCLLLVIAYLISRTPTSAEGKRARRNRRLNARESR